MGQHVFSPTDTRLFSHRYTSFLPPIHVFSPTDLPRQPLSINGFHPIERALRSLRFYRYINRGEIPLFFERQKGTPPAVGARQMRPIGRRASRRQRFGSGSEYSEPSISSPETLSLRLRRGLKRKHSASVSKSSINSTLVLLSAYCRNKEAYPFSPQK